LLRPQHQTLGSVVKICRQVCTMKENAARPEFLHYREMVVCPLWCQRESTPGDDW